MRTPALLAASVLLALGCGNDFNPEYRLVKARVLALQADPPQPQLGNSTTLRALLYLPEGEPPSYHWSWCPVPTSADNGFECPIDQAGFDQMLGLGPDQAPSLDLGTGETATLTNLFPPETLAALCTGNADVTLGGGAGAAPDAGAQSELWSCASAGFPITVRMELQTPSMAEVAPAVFKVYLPIDATQPGNQNPVMGGLATIEPAPGQGLDEAGSVTLQRHRKYKLHLDMDQSVSEAFVGWTRDELGGYATTTNGDHIIGGVQEIIRLNWYAEGGDLGDGDKKYGGVTGYNPYESAPQPFPSALGIDWTTPKKAAYDKDSARIMVVVRDDRGGVAWASAVVTLESQP
jgi:hypothetical protein